MSEDQSKPVPEPASRADDRSAPTGPSSGDSPTVVSSWSPRPLGRATPAYLAGPAGLVQGECLEHFELQEPIGVGGMGTVFRAWDTRLKRPVALKVLPQEQAADSELVQRFVHEAQSAARLNHENIARVFYIGESRNLHYIAFEFVEGIDVRRLIEQYGRWPVNDVISVAIQVAAALKHAAACDVIHRDIKPSNIVITPEGRAKLVDMGLARHFDAQGGLTASGVTLGSFDYISPEQAQDPRSADVRSDIYSLGCTLYHMLTRRPPFPEGTALQKLLQHREQQPPDPQQFNPEIPDELARIVRRMMRKRPKDRYQSPDDLLKDLTQLSGTLGLHPMYPEGLIWMAPGSIPVPVWQRHAAWTIPVLLLLLSVLTAWVIYDTQQREQQPLRPVATPVPPKAARQAAGRFSARATSAPSESVTRAGRPPNVTQPALSAGRGSATVAGNRQASSLSANDRERFARSTTAADLSSGRAAGDPTVVPGYASSYPNGASSSSDSGQVVNAAASESSPVVDEPGGSDWARSIVVRVGPPAIGASVSVTATSRSGPSVAAGSLSLAGHPHQPTRRQAQNWDVSSPVERQSTTTTSHDLAPRRVETVTPATSAGGTLTVSAGILVVDPGGSVGSYPTLEAALAQVRGSGVVELRYNGSLRQSPLPPISGLRRLTIRAAHGFDPVLVLDANASVAEETARLLHVRGGTLDLIGLHLVLDIPTQISERDWGFVGFENGQRLNIQDCTFTIRNPGQHPAAFIEVLWAWPGLASVPMGEEVHHVVELDLKKNFFRGGAEVVRLERPDQIFIRMEDNNLVATSQNLLSVHTQSTEHNPQVRLRLAHVTARVDQGLIEVQTTGAQPQIEVIAENNIFVTANSAPLVRQTGRLSVADFRGLLVWKGQRNFYDGFDPFWSIESTLPGTMAMDPRTTRYDFDAWTEFWGKDAEWEPQRNLVRWSPPGPLPALSWEAEKRRFTLDANAPDNPALKGSTDGRDAGADLSTLPSPPHTW